MKKHPPRSKYWRNKADKLWSEAVRAKYGNRCAVCGKTGTNAHHLIGRRVGAMRHDLQNGIALCPYHHTFSAELSPHQAPLQFSEWMQQHHYEQFIYVTERYKEVNRNSEKPNYREAYEALKDRAEHILSI